MTSGTRTDDYMSGRETLERLVTLERDTDNKFEAMDKALELARDTLDKKLSGMNEFQKRIDRLEGTLATKDALEILDAKLSKEIATMQKYVSMVIGGLVVLEIVLRFLLKAY
jgi:hypothetical protein